MSHDHGCDTLLSYFHNESDCTRSKTLLKNARVCCNGCCWLHNLCSGLQQSADHTPDFKCPRYISKAVHCDRSVSDTALLTDLHTKNQDHTTSLPPREAQVVADDANDRPIIATAPKNVAEKNKSIYETFWHTLHHNVICYWQKNVIIYRTKTKQVKNFWKLWWILGTVCWKVHLWRAFIQGCRYHPPPGSPPRQIDQQRVG